MDGIPINTADGFGDFQEIDPTAYRYVEVYKGANALRFGASSLGGAINFVTPTGRDADLFGASADIGSFGFHAAAVELRRRQRAGRLLHHRLRGRSRTAFATTAGAMPRGPAPISATSSRPTSRRASTSTPTTCGQRIPGSVTKDVALTSPTTAAADQRHRRLAAQHRHAAHRQQDDLPARARHQSWSSACSGSTAT